ncbi:HAMP domain-containing sensor histidine kinase [Phenylobacterium sp.]|uniref:sensor histidine kinase n=1 Tax=Phenylobacterium sp. TaxID=1871053 RepID=UPI0012166E05|nr:HAMP domain-containing sensor histidine kinase [Phenylobacterium sp.]THD61299.1 MAG: HAMP domain-containing histidine kinase [Phenylobacterium sp.]
MQSLRRLLASASFRLALLQTLLFVAAFAAAGLLALTAVRRAEHRAAHAEIEEFEDDITDRLVQDGVAGLIARSRSHRHDPARAFRLEDAQGHLLAGDLAPPPGPLPAAPKFWITYRAQDPAPPNRSLGEVMAYSRPEPGGQRLIVGEYLRLRAQQDDATLLAAAGLAAVVAALGMAGGMWAGRSVLRRVDGMVQSIERYSAGDRAARIAAAGQGGAELDELGTALNSMMDRENRLVEGLRQVSSAIAHDLRRPLAHHNQEIAQALAGARTAAHYRRALVGASARVDEVLETFQALLHIAELEAGAPGLALQPVNLDTLAAKVVEAYAPGAEAAGRSLHFFPGGGAATIEAEPRVLGEALANLIENALTHTPPGARAEVRVEAEGRRVTVSDDGPGVPAALRGKIFQRFFRGDASRSTPGSGLGLALALAAVNAFGGRLTAEDAQPGLRIVADFSGAAAD